MRNTEYEIKEIPIDKIVFIDNPRGKFKDVDIASLMQDIKQRGILQPIGVKVSNEDETEYVFIWGSRRITAAKKLGWTKIEAKVYSEDLGLEEVMLMSVIENIHRKELSPTELGRVCTLLMDEYNMSIDELASRLSFPVSRITSVLRIYKMLPAKYRKLVEFHDASAGRKTKSGTIPVSQWSILLDAKRSFGMTDGLFDKFVKLVKQEGMSAAKLHKIFHLMRYQKLTLVNAVNSMDNYAPINCSFYVKKKAMKKVREKHKNQRTDLMMTQIFEKYASGLSGDSKDLE